MTATIDTARDPMVEAAVHGDREAFGVLWREHHNVIYRTLNYLVRDRHLAEDLTSETFTLALAGIQALRTDTSFRPWLYSIARHQVLDHRRSARTRLDSLRPAEDLPDWEATDDTEREVISREHAAVALRSLASMSEDYRVVLALRFLRGLSREQTAEAMGRSQESVRALQWKATAKLRADLAAGGWGRTPE